MCVCASNSRKTHRRIVCTHKRTTTKRTTAAIIIVIHSEIINASTTQLRTQCKPMPLMAQARFTIAYVYSVAGRIDTTTCDAIPFASSSSFSFGFCARDACVSVALRSVFILLWYEFELNFLLVQQLRVQFSQLLCVSVESNAWTV